MIGKSGMSGVSQRFVVLGVNTILVVILSYIVTLQGLSFLLPTQIKAPSSIIVPPPTHTVNNTSSNFKQLSHTALFGEITAATAHTTTTTELPPETRLNLTLRGIYYSSTVQDSFAMIAQGQQDTKLYRVGDQLTNAVTIAAIYAKHVTLSRFGKQEILRLEGDKDSQTNITTSSATNTQQSGRLLAQYQQQLRTNPQTLARLMRITPATHQGETIGYRLGAGQEKGILSQFGLQSGDILTEVNGVRLDSPLKGLQVVQKLAHTRQIDLNILRNGQTEYISLSVEH